MPDNIANPSNISTELGRILKARNDIRSKLNSMNLGTSSDNITTLSSIVNDIPYQGNIIANVNVGESYTIPRGYHTGSGTITGTQGSGQFLLQTPDPVTPTKNAQNITPGNGFYGLAAVTVKPIPEAFQDVTSVNALPSQVLATRIYVDSTGSIITGTMANNGAVLQTISVASPTYTVPTGYHNGSGTVTVSLEEKTATPTTSAQNITPTNGKVLSKVTVNAIPAPYYNTSGVTAVASHVLTGEKYVDSSGTTITGTMSNNQSWGATLDVRAGHSYITVPSGYHTGNGTVDIVTEVQEVIPSTSTQAVTPSAGKVLSQVTVKPIPPNYKDTTGADAVAGNVLTGKKFVNSTGLVTGTMANNGAVSQTLSTTSTQYTVPVGYHNGSGTVKIVTEDKTLTPAAAAQTVYATAGKVINKVTVNAIPAPYYNTSGVTAVASHVLTGEKFVNSSGTTVTGTMADNSAISQTLSTTSTQYTVPIGYHNGSGTVKIVTEDKTMTPTTAAQTVYPAAGKVFNKITVNAIPSKYKDTTDADAVAANVLSGKKFVNSTGTVTGTMANNGTVSQTLSTTTTQFTIFQGYHSGSGTVNIVTEDKTLTPTAAVQTVYATTGKVIKKVTVNAIPTPYYNTSGVTAVASHVLTGEKFVNSSGTTVTGTMANIGAVNQTLSTTSTQYTVPTGFHSGSGTVKIATEEKTFTPTNTTQTVYATAGKVINKVVVNAIPSPYYNVSDVTAVESHLLEGDVFIDSRGMLRDGTMVNNGAVSEQLNVAITSYTIPEGYHDGTGVVYITTESATATPVRSSQIIIPSGDNLLSRVVVEGISDSWAETGGDDAVAADLLSGKKAHTQANGSAVRITGTMANNGAVNQTLTTASTQYTVPTGYHNGSGTVKIVLETKSATPTTSAQTITPTTGKVLSSVTVNAIPSAYQDVTGVTAVASHVLTGEKFVNSSGTTVTGTMADRGSGGRTLYMDSTTAQQSISSGFYDGTGKISVAYTTRTVTPTKASQNIVGDGTSAQNIPYLAAVTVNAIPSEYQNVTGVTAVASHVLTGEKFVSSSGTTVTGTMVNNGAVNQTLSTTSTQYTVPQGYHNGSGTVKIVTEDRTLTPAAAAQTIYATAGKVINKVTVNAIPAPYYDVSGVTAVASHVVTGEKYVDSSGATITGTMAVNSGSGAIILHTAQYNYTIESGYHVNKQVVSVAYESKTVTPSTSTQHIWGTSRSPSGNNLLSTVVVNPIPTKYKDTTGADAVAANVLSGKKFVNTTGTVTGTMTNNGSYTSSIDGLTIASKLIPQGYHDGTGYIYLTNDIEVALAAI